MSAATVTPTSTETTFLRAVPVLAALDIPAAVAFYERAGFTTRYQAEDGEYAIVQIGNGGVEIHFWKCDDRRIAENTGCRVEVTGVEPLYEKHRALGIVHPNGALSEQPWGTREFVMVDDSGNIVTFFERLAAR